MATKKTKAKTTKAATDAKYMVLGRLVHTWDVIYSGCSSVEEALIAIEEEAGDFDVHYSDYLIVSYRDADLITVANSNVRLMQDGVEIR